MKCALIVKPLAGCVRPRARKGGGAARRYAVRGRAQPPGKPNPGRPSQALRGQTAAQWTVASVPAVLPRRRRMIGGRAETTGGFGGSFTLVGTSAVRVKSAHRRS